MARVSLILFALLVLSLSAFSQGSSVGTAASLAANGGSGGATITSQFANQYWKVTTTTDGYLRLNIVSGSSIDVNTILYDTNGSTSITSDNNTTTNSEVYAFVKPGTYYLLVYLWSGTSGSYTVTTAFSSPTRAQETESNDTPSSAVTLSPTGTATGHIGFYSAGQYDTKDYWKITTTEDGWLRVQVRSDSLDLRGDRRLDVNVILYDVNGSTSITSDNVYGTFSEVSWFVRPGTYYVYVYQWDGRAGSYEIKSDFFAPPLANDIEGNDTYQTASTALVNGSTTGHLGFYSNGTTDNDDYWKFTTTTDGKVVVKTVTDSLDRSGTRFDLNLIVYDINGTSSITSDNRYGTVSECTMFLRPGTYYARVYRWDGDAVSYTISVNQTTPSRANDTEGNDWYSASSSLALNVQSTGHLGYYSNGSTDNTDIWRVVASSTDSLYVHVSSDATIDLNVVAYASDTTYSITSDSRADTYSRVGIKPTSGMTYYFKLYLWSGTAGAYSIIASRSYIAVGVEKTETETLIPRELVLEQNYPNPFNPSTTIRFGLPEQQHVRLSVYSILGQELAVLMEGTKSASTYTVVWNGRDVQGAEVPSGLYIIRLQAGDKQIVKKAMLVR